MARRYYRSRRAVVVRPKKKWASNLKIINETSGGPGCSVELCSNSAPTSTPTPVILKTGNFKVRIDSQIQYTGNVEAWPSLNFYVVYLPEGFSTPTGVDTVNEYVTKHPEWILCSGVAGSNTVTASKFDLETATFSSRLKRNLNSGDKIVLLGAPAMQSLGVTSTIIRGVVKYWTCAN